jgi:outer membrane protein assembly factor BamD (BamD/ComL family)
LVTPRSALAEQNRLLQAALAARREGRDADALAKLDELLRAYPNSPLAQEAHANRFRALEKLGRHAEAVVEAQTYLAEYPDGFARDEAKAILAK